MTTARMEAFSDGVIAVLITILVLELHAPGGADLNGLLVVAPGFLVYALSFVFLGIYWNNHHHMLMLTEHVNGRILWANLHLLFWLSLVPFVTAWMGQHPFEAVPTALYGLVLLLAAVAYTILQGAIIADQGARSHLAAAVGRDAKGKISALLYLVAIPLALAIPAFADVIYIAVALVWLVPDRRIERRITGS
jgi:uncharacterized membrane protein